MFELKQKSITVNISGKLRFEVESMIPAMDSIDVVQKDSAAVEFEMSLDYKVHSLERSEKMDSNDSTASCVVSVSIKSKESLKI